MTQALLGGETVLLVLISLLVVGLLRSHAEILRRLESQGVTPVPRPPETGVGYRGGRSRPEWSDSVRRNPADLAHPRLPGYAARLPDRRLLKLQAASR